MKFEKFFNSKIFIFFEMLYRLMVANMLSVLLIVLGLGVFSIMPSIVSLIIVVRSFRHDTDFPIIKVFLLAFKKNYKRLLLLTFFYLAIGSIFTFNTFYFYTALKEYQTLFYEVAFNLMIVIDLIFGLMFLNACFIYVYFPNLNNKKVIKYSLVLLRAIPIQAIIIIIMLIGAIFLFVSIPILFIFILLSLYIYIINLMLKNTYQRLVVDGVKSLDAFTYVDMMKK